MRKNKKIMITLVAFAIVLLSVVGSYAFFTSAINNDNKTTAELNTATLALTFADHDNGINERLMFGESVTKKFTITNTGTRDASLSLDWTQLINTYMDGSLSYNLTYATTEEGEYIEIIPKTNMPTSNERLTQTLAGELSVPTGETYYYNLTITLNNLDAVDQTPDKDAIFNTKFSVGQPLKYRYYTLTVDPNEGTWEEFTAPQNYLLKNNETKDIAIPSRIGYTFNGWNLKGVSSDLTDTTFTMGISDAVLTAKWKLNQYTLTINPDGGTYTGDTSVTMDYESAIELAIPTKKGYTFTGWNVTGGRVENNTFTLTEPNDALLTATWQINNYKYIVYHNQMNIDGNGYSLISADTDEGEAEYNSTVDPSVKTYTGFTSPNVRSLTIDEETEYPPVKNKIDYNYDRNKYYLTINNNNGTENIIQKIYYGSSITLTIPTKTGYTFANWDASSGTLTENDFTIEDSDATVKANYTPNKYSVTFNANGGTIAEVSKQVVYDETYGTLPTPTRTGYTFEGWYTATSDGEEKTADTIVNITEDETLYAIWTINSYTVTVSAGAGGSVNPTSLNVTYGGTNTFTVTPNSGYKLNNISCSNGYTTTGWSSGSTSSQTVTIKNPSSTNSSTCTVSFTANTVTYTIETVGSWDTNNTDGACYYVRNYYGAYNYTPITKTFNYKGHSTCQVSDTPTCKSIYGSGDNFWKHGTSYDCKSKLNWDERQGFWYGGDGNLHMGCSVTITCTD